MPTTAEIPRPGNVGLRQQYSHEASNRSWTDDLPVCRLSGVGLSTNQIYREDGQRQEDHDFEDRSSHFRLDDNTFFYGVFDGHEGSRAADFAAQHMPAEVLLGQLSNKTSDKEVKEVLHEAFTVVEKSFFESIDHLLAQKANLQLEIPDGLSNYETYQKYPDLVRKLQDVNTEISGGTTAVVALVYNNRLFVANVGDSRALLCRKDTDNCLRVTQLSVDHDFRNEDELLRLSQLGLDIDKIRQSSKVGNQTNTRCIGNYMVKGEYRDFENLRNASSEPVISEPEVHGGIPIDSSFSFLILMSDGLYKTLEEVTATEQANQDIASMVADQFEEQSTLTGVAQAVVDKIVRLHHDCFMNNSIMNNRGVCQQRDDITLLVRHFFHPMPNAVGSPQPRVQFNPNVSVLPDIRYVIPADDPSLFSSANNNNINITNNNYTSSGGESTTTETETDTTEGTDPSACISGPTRSSQANTSSTDSDERFIRAQGLNNQLPLDEEGRIEPYVDFSDYYRAVEEAKRQGILPLNVNGDNCNDSE